MAKALENKAEIPADIAKLSFEEALEKLEEIIDRLEGGEVNLDDSIDIYTRGTALRLHCENKLKDAKARIDKIVERPDGGLGTAPAEID